jgi:hypothetical protein
MIIPTMTLEEIRKEISKDFPILDRKVNYVVHDLLKKLSNYEKTKGYVQFFDYCSKYKNHWIYRLNVSKKDSGFDAMLLYHSGKGHAAISVTRQLSLIYHTGHFFERYNERCKLGLKTLNDIIRAYMNENDVYHFQEGEEITTDTVTMFCNIPSGIVLGTYNKKLDFVKANTFVPNGMLTRTQKELSDELKKALEKDKDTFGDLN